MKKLTEKREQGLGWVLATAMALHLFLLHPRPVISLTAFAVLLTGAVLRGRQLFPPRWLARTLMLLAVVAVLFAQEAWEPASLMGELAATAGTLMLLRALSPGRVLRVLLCFVVILLAMIIRPFPTVGTPFLIGDVIVLYLLAEQAYRPPEAEVSFWVSVVRSFRVILPVAIVVLGVFTFFPSMSLSPQGLTGFSGDGILDAGSLAKLAQSHRVAMTAHFDKEQALPPASALYWRGQVLEANQGFLWSVDPSRNKRFTSLETTMPEARHGLLRYRQELSANRGGIVPALDHAVFIDAKRSGQDVVVQSNEAGVLAAVGAGDLTLQVASTPERLTDVPAERSSTRVPKDVAQSGKLHELAGGIFTPEADTPAKLRELTRYFQTGGYRYTLRPGRMQDLETFLLKQKQGFCEHYATAAANLLRLAGIPTRVVTGFRGGEWNPWLRTITVRDSDAHAWVEAWDSATRRWLRYDPTDAVAPDLRASIQREMDSSRWPWYRRTWSYGRALVTDGANRIEQVWTNLTSSDSWENVPLTLFITLVIVALIWLVRNMLARRPAGPREAMARLLAELERRAQRVARERRLGETPLAWLHRLEGAAAEPQEKQALHHLAATYETGMYAPGAQISPLLTETRQTIHQLARLWKNRPTA